MLCQRQGAAGAIPRPGPERLARRPPARLRQAALLLRHGRQPRQLFGLALVGPRSRKIYLRQGALPLLAALEGQRHTPRDRVPRSAQPPSTANRGQRGVEWDLRFLIFDLRFKPSTFSLILFAFFATTLRPLRLSKFLLTAKDAGV